MTTPFTLGAIDAGSNAIRVVVSTGTGTADLTRVVAQRVPVRLGRGAFTRGELDAEMIDGAVEAFRGFRELFDQHGVDRYRAVATSAVRSAHNRDILLHRLFHEAGIELEVIDGDEEARLVRKAVVEALGEDVTPEAILDLGGGSLEITLRRGGGWKGFSLPVGTVRLLETFGLDGALGPDEAGMVRRYAATLLHTISGLKAELAPAAACGGNAEAFARLFGDDAGFDIAALEMALPDILGADVEGRMAKFNVRRDRAEVMGVAAIVLATCGRGMGLDRLHVPRVGIRDALLLELAEAEHAEKARAEDAQGKALITAARTFAHRVGHDTTHGEQVRRLALLLFDQTRHLHQLPDDVRVVLALAALLHDVGEVIHGRSHHKHGEYMVKNGRIQGLDSPYREMVAALVRTHRKSAPDAKKHATYAELSKERQRQVRRLCALLRLADGLDTAHRQRIDDILVSRVGDTITLDLVVADGPDGDDGSFLRKADLFEAEFGLGVTCTVARPISDEIGVPPAPLHS